MTRDELKDLAEKAVRQVCAASPHRADGDNRKRLVMMTRALIAGAMLLVASTPSQPETVNQYITDTSNPDLKEAMEAYAIGVGHGFFWYQAVAGAVNRDPTGQSRLFCLPANTNFSGKTLQNASRKQRREKMFLNGNCCRL